MTPEVKNSRNFWRRVNPEMIEVMQIIACKNCFSSIVASSLSMTALDDTAFIHSNLAHWPGQRPPDAGFHLIGLPIYCAKCQELNKQLEWDIPYA